VVPSGSRHQAWSAFISILLLSALRKDGFPKDEILKQIFFSCNEIIKDPPSGLAKRKQILLALTFFSTKMATQDEKSLLFLYKKNIS
jgi:hypothetical protein